MDLKHMNTKYSETDLAGYKFLALITMLYMSIMLCNAILTNRYIGTNDYFVLGGSFTSPFFFILGDIIAEIYGYKIAKNIIWYGFASLTLFVIICQIVMAAPYPTFFSANEAYTYVLGQSLVRIDISSFAAYILANLINARIISKWKILLKGRYFWLRSLGASTFSEALYSFIAIVMMELYSIPLENMFKVICLSFLIKISYSIIFAAPATLLVNYIKKSTSIDVYDFSMQYTPFKYLKLNRGNQYD